ncbi:MAG: hypothetical protein R3E04_09900 [Sphingobium sp.]
MKDEYIKLVLLRFSRTVEFDNIFGDQWLLGTYYEPIALEVIKSAFKKFDVDINPKIYLENFGGIFGDLIAGNAVVYDGDEFTDRWFKLIPANKQNIIDRLLKDSAANSLIKKLGPEALNRAIQKITSDIEDDVKVEKDLSSLSFLESIPAADRIVTRNDNLEKISEAEKILDDINGIISSSSNEVGDAIGHQREIIEGEIAHAQNVLKSPRFRISSLIGWLAPVLRYLSDKFAGGAIADAAKRLLELLITLV